jgi:hypothetical protein
MSQRENTLLWLKDMLDHLQLCQQQLTWAEDADMVRVVTENMLRDLESCRRLCEDLHRRARLGVAA